TQEHGKQPQRRKQQNVMNEDSLFQENVNFAHRTRHPVSAILVEKFVHVAEIFLRPVGSGRALALPGDYENRKDGTYECCFANENFLGTALAVKAECESDEQKQVGDIIYRAFKPRAESRIRKSNAREHAVHFIQQARKKEE